MPPKSARPTVFNLKVLYSVALLLCGFGTASAQNTKCTFNLATLSYEGAPVEQAKCLLRPVKIFANLGPRVDTLPEPLGNLVGQSVTVSKEALRRFLATRVIREADIGGSLDAPLSPANTASPQIGRAKYFIIHDTSSPHVGNAEFPAQINERNWPGNDLSRQTRKVAHVFVNRAGDSATLVDFKDLLPAGNFGTKFAVNTLGANRKGLLLHVEMIQPRRCFPGNQARCTPPDKNDATAPDPGFSEAQLDRLALIYVAASVRRGEWMIPAFHAVMDVTIPNGHDDPQQFNLDLWAERLKQLIASIQQN